MYKKDAGREVCATQFTFDQNKTELVQTETAAYQTCSEVLPNEHRLICPEQTEQAAPATTESHRSTHEGSSTTSDSASINTASLYDYLKQFYEKVSDRGGSNRGQCPCNSESGPPVAPQQGVCINNTMTDFLHWFCFEGKGRDKVSQQFITQSKLLKL